MIEFQIALTDGEERKDIVYFQKIVHRLKQMKKESPSKCEMGYFGRKSEE